MPAKMEKPRPAPGKTSRSGLLEFPGMGFIQTVETVRAINRALLIIIVLLITAIVSLSVALMSSRESITVFVPPDTTRGNITTAGTPSPAAIYGFAAITLQNLHHWPADGQRDYRAAIDGQALFLSPTFRRQLMEDYTRLTNRGGINELRGRTRALFPLPERLFSPDRVVRTGDGTWSVTLEFRLVETIEGAAIKDIAIRYAVRVVQADVDPNGNVWGLMLDGFLQEPVRLPRE